MVCKPGGYQGKCHVGYPGRHIRPARQFVVVALYVNHVIDFLAHIAQNRLEAFVYSRSEWCISRQRVWGVPIPALHHIPTERVVLDSTTLEYILSVLEKRGVAHWWDGPVDDFVPPSLRQEDVPVSELWRKGTDTMDVWFDSGTSWSLLGETCGTEGVSAMKQGRLVADVCLEGSDQHRGWFQSQLLTAIGSASGETYASSPYRTLITHGMVLDEEGKKMSKSLGNVMDPMEIVNGPMVCFQVCNTSLCITHFRTEQRGGGKIWRGRTSTLGCNSRILA